MHSRLRLALGVSAVLIVGCGRPTPTESGKPSAPAITGDAERLQGVWRVDSVDSGRKAEDYPPEQVARELEQVRKGSFSFTGDHLTVNLLGQTDTFRFRIDESQAPKVLFLTVEKEAGPQPLEWIYKFEGDVFVVAFKKGGGKPSEFKAVDAPSVQEVGAGFVQPITVVRLKKTDAPPQPVNNTVPIPSRPGTSR